MITILLVLLWILPWAGFGFALRAWTYWRQQYFNATRDYLRVIKGDPNWDWKE